MDFMALSTLQKSFLIGLGLMGVNFAAALLHRLYLQRVVLPKKKYHRSYQPAAKQWVEFVTASQNSEFKGLLVLGVVILGGGYFLGYFTEAAGVLIILVSLSLYTFLAGLYRPEYVLTEEGLFIQNWFPPYINRNMGYYPWTAFTQMEVREHIIVLGEKKIIPLVCQEKEATEMRRYIRRRVKTGKEDGAND